MLDQPMSAKQALIVKLQECTTRLPNADADEIFAQAEALDGLIKNAVLEMRSESSTTASQSDAEQIRHLLASYSLALTQSQGRISRALGALGLDAPVYPENEHASRRTLPVAGVRPTSLTA